LRSSYVHERKTTEVGTVKYLQLICIEGETDTPEASATMREQVGPWVEETVARRVNVVGKPLDAPASAKTVRVQNGETLISDGPFADTKEFIAGLDILECENLDEAIEVAAKHPVSWFHAIELRPFDDGMDGVHIPDFIDSSELQHMLLVRVDGIPEPPEVEAQLARDCKAWRNDLRESGIGVLSQPLAGGQDNATTVRVRDGETLITDGPFIETKEFLAGIDILKCDTVEEAAGWAATHPIAHFHKIEVRRFIDLSEIQ
jgi:hypothetical protein